MRIIFLSNYNINWGWVDPQNRKSLRTTFVIHPGTPYWINFNLQPDDYVFQPGHRIGIVVLSSDHYFTKRPPDSTGDTVISVDVKKITIPVPIVGGETALANALPEE
ncbi:CocE/NonD family hydrolase C-terminal non-catalytic domain-containing protein [Haladaptatus pallidirubidus]|uniref:Xaa-Pro dipeptidyl-peptidase C-terminal domain-containing protein n=1 Tax=Haladaptatus pallidirubidus TaxID=1008152 RepID=A0AAV3UHB5_9EURY